MDPNINPHDVELREQDRWLPIANVARLMKNTLPTTAKVSKDAKECMQECVSEFISFITSEASDRCVREKRKTINGEDILYSMHDLGFENYAEVLKIYLAKYREQQALRQARGETRSSQKQAKQAAAVAAASATEGSSVGDMNENGADFNQSQTNSPRSNLEHEQAHQGAAAEFLEEANHEQFINDNDLEPTQIGAPDQREIDSTSVTNVSSAVGSNPSSTSSINSPQHFYDDFGDDRQAKIKQEGEVAVPNPKVLPEDYQYDDFINEEPNEEQQSNNGHHNIDEFTKITHDEPDIDNLTAGITNSTSNGSYF
ncbi:histone-fold-containing protein [Suhomyces tanzawaensis NRRL Y-17324]|uniref:Histone-fold-containing protein n=1 Tax=Suhomyces tanzawaensis NRRL Y-17324 TaxID=984487 RepID=A0A1E4SKF0_9ASCO|nr:histone-fold-containing protein [Suhomyces tanzawaensis NRRL Y-17324]ODV79986.1 histone-fold-containing protein [Suhomyces tanzawaensis NRRL Y-17324]